MQQETPQIPATSNPSQPVGPAEQAKPFDWSESGEPAGTTHVLDQALIETSINQTLTPTAALKISPLEESAARPGVPAPEARRDHRKAVLTALSALIISAGLANVFVHDSSTKSSTRPSQPVPGTASPAPITSIIPRVRTAPTTEAPVTIDPSTTVVARTHNTLATTATNMAEGQTNASEKLFLSDAEKQNMIAVTGYEGLAGHKLEIVDQHNTGTARIVILGLDGAKVPTSISKIESDIDLAETEAARQPAFTTSIQLSPGVTRDVTFNIKPSGGTHYFIFTNSDQNLDSLTKPYTGFEDSSTIKRSSITVSIVKDHGPQATIDGVNADYFYVDTEIGWSSMNFSVDSATAQQLKVSGADMSYLTNPNWPNPTPDQRMILLALLGGEIWTNSRSYAVQNAQLGVPYLEYKKQAEAIPLRSYLKNKVFYLPLSESQYKAYM